jgi:hypothetical protein
LKDEINFYARNLSGIGFSGVSLAESCGVPAEVCHIIAAHAGEGNMVKRSTEAFIVHHADFMTFLPFKQRSTG